MAIRKLRHRLLALFIGMFCCIPAALPDDTEIYTNPAVNSVQAPYTVLVIDLNLLGICNSVLTQTSNPNNPDSPQLCLNVTSSIILSDLLGGVTSNPVDYLYNLLFGAYGCTSGSTPAQCSAKAQGLCNLYGVLGLIPPAIPIPGISFLLSLVLNGVTTLSCTTLSFLLSVPLVGTILNSIMASFVGDLIQGLITPLLSTVVGQLPSVLLGVLQSTISGVLNLGQQSLVTTLESILNNLIGSNVAIMVSHADRATLLGAPASSCAFGDLAAIPGTRRSTSGCSNGAYMIAGFTQLVDVGSVNSMVSLVSNLLTNALSPTNLLNATTAIAGTALTTPASLLPPYQGKEVYAELAQFLAGKEVFNAPLARWDGLTGLITRDTSIELSNGNYRKPALECSTANILNLMLTNNIRDSESDARLRSIWPALPSGAITLADVVRQAADVGVTDINGRQVNMRSYFLIQNLLTSTTTLGNAGATVLTYANSLGLLNLGKSTASLLKPVIDIDASLLTPSLTVDLTTPSAVRPESFFGLFKPDTLQKPRWNGNLKRLRVAADSSGNYQYYDANSTLAIDTDGRIKPTALSFWTTSSQLGTSTRDGRSVTLGGAGQKIPGYQFGGGGNPGRVNSDGKRTLYYDKIASGSFALAGLDADTQTVRDELATDLGVTGTTTADDKRRRELLLYARGFDVGSAAAPLGSGDTVTGVTARGWMHGAVLHSRPVAINYGARGTATTTSPDIRVVYGANDGLLRMVRNSDGVETWGFMPRVLMSQQNTLRENTAGSALPYGVDGAPAVLLQDRNSSGGPADGKIESSNSNDRAWMYFGLRRSGRYYYGMNLTNPDAPSLLWRIGPDGLYRSTGLISGTSGFFSELGMTFSNPQIGRMRVTDSGTTTTRSVVVFAGGYNGGVSGSSKVGKDLNRGSDNRVGTDDTVGNAIYIVDAQTGDLIWKARQGTFSSSTPYNSSTRAFQHPLLLDSIPSDVNIIDTDGDGLIDRLYVGDTGGRLWRADFPAADRSAWVLTPLASLGRHRNSNVANDRRFFQAPDFAPLRSNTGNYDVITIGSGDREDPLNTATQNFLYSYRDFRVVSNRTASEVITSDSTLKGQTDFVDLTTTCASGSASCGSTLDLSTGWRIQLTGSGEKTFSQPLSASGTTFFSTYTPPSTSTVTCTPSEGTNRIYGVSLTNSRPTVASFINDGDGTQRSQATATPGLPGEFNALTADALAVNTSTQKIESTPRYTIYWRERRSDEETAP